MKLFKLFNDDNINVTIGEDIISGIKQNKIKFVDETVELTSIINSDENMVKSVPTTAIRTMAKDSYPYEISADKKSFAEIINRIMLFMPNTLYLQPIGKFEFDKEKLKISDKTGENYETLFYSYPIEMEDDVSLMVDFNDIKLVLDNTKEELVTVKFGNSRAIVIQRANVYNVIPECN